MQIYGLKSILVKNYSILINELEYICAEEYFKVARICQLCTHIAIVLQEPPVSHCPTVCFF